MAGVITTGSIPKSLWPGIKHWWGSFYNDYNMQYLDLFDKDYSDKQYEEDVQVVSFGLAPQKAEGSPVTYDSENQGFVNRSTHVAFALGYIVTREEIADNLYEKVARRRTESLARSMYQTKENVGANVYNRAFNSSFAFADGKELIATDHPTQAGDQSNELTVAADLSEASLEDLSIQIMKAKDDRNLTIQLLNRSLIVPPDLHFEAHRILGSVYQNDTANNAINVLYSDNRFPEGIKINQYLTDTDAYFIRTTAPGLVYYERDSIEFSQDNDFDTENLKVKSYERYSFTNYDWRAIYGSPGA